MEVDNCREAFEKWLDSRAISMERDKDGWGRERYKHSHVDAMWAGYFAAWNTLSALRADDAQMHSENIQTPCTLNASDAQGTDKYDALIDKMEETIYTGKDGIPFPSGDDLTWGEAVMNCIRIIRQHQSGEGKPV